MIHCKSIITVMFVIVLQLSTLNSFVKFGVKTIPMHKDFYSQIVYNSDLKATHQTVEISSSSSSPSSNTDDIIQQYYDEIVSLRGTPELVDRLENLANIYPGIELNINLYRAIYPFKLDDFQIDGLTGLINGKNMIVCTPTGSGKTIVGELAIYFALMMGLKVVYTTPLKALSNQKFQDFCLRYGGDRVGLLTGDVAINRGATVTVMTTEVFRNMVYDGDSYSQLANLFMVCFDEFHYMNDPDRGTVWEESVISCPSFIRILALSATMGNVEDIQGWLTSIHGPTELVLSNHRPVPLRYLFALKKSLLPLFRDPNAGPGAINGVKKISAAGVVVTTGSAGAVGGLTTVSTTKTTTTQSSSSSSSSAQVVPILSNGERYDPSVSINPSILKMEEQAVQNSQFRMTKSGRPLKQQKFSQNILIPKYHEVIADLHQLKLLPAIVFLFSRVGCDDSAKALLSYKLNLLTKEEVEYVTVAINNFAKLHPEIPIAKSSVQILKHGVGVHHAGLIPVWKGFIETLFNENKIKVLFATETLAAGVNMPARTTVISSVTKRVSSEIIKLKTSQLLQMAGRAGRRGKDESGTVVILRNRYEDVKMCHKILISPTDGIKSHFRTSYGLTVKLLETRSFDECRSLVEKGFGSYLLQKKLALKTNAVVSGVNGVSSSIASVESSGNSALEDAIIQREAHRAILQKYSLKVAREYFKLFRKLEKERSNEMFLLSKWQENDSDLVQAIVEYMPLGAGLLLCNNVTGYFLGDVKWGSDNSGFGYGVIVKPHKPSPAAAAGQLGDQDMGGMVIIVKKEHIRSFYEPEDSIPARSAKDMLDVLSLITQWDEVAFDKSAQQIFMSTSISPSSLSTSTSITSEDSPNGATTSVLPMSTVTTPSSKKSSILLGKITRQIIKNNDKIAQALVVIRASSAFRAPELPGSIIRQKQLINEVEQEFRQHPVVINQEQNLIIDALRYVSQLKDPIGFVSDKSAALSFVDTNRNDKKGSDTSSSAKEKEVYAWTVFVNVIKLLQFYKAMDSNYKPTELGRLVGSLSGDNELWAALVIRSPNINLLNAAELAAVVCALTTDGYKARNAFFKYEPSDRVKAIYAEIEAMSWDLKDAQNEYNLDFPIHLCQEMGGLVESWVSGLSWRELCRDTNMDQGDLCRTFRRTVELLKQIPVANGVDRQVADVAMEAVKKMNRFPVADYNDQVDVGTIMSVSGDSGTSGSSTAGVGFGNFEGNVDDMYNDGDAARLRRGSAATAVSGSSDSQDAQERALANFLDFEGDDDEDDVVVDLNLAATGTYSGGRWAGDDIIETDLNVDGDDADADADAVTESESESPDIDFNQIFGNFKSTSGPVSAGVSRAKQLKDKYKSMLKDIDGSTDTAMATTTAATATAANTAGSDSSDTDGTGLSQTSDVNTELLVDQENDYSEVNDDGDDDDDDDDDDDKMSAAAAAAVASKEDSISSMLADMMNQDLDDFLKEMNE